MTNDPTAIKKATARVLKLAGPWAAEMATREVLASKTYHLVKAILKLKELEKGGTK